ncbi:hypothetical protein AWB69_09149 [Caballeronia udeis]|uniref:Uncharacterized protein n=1 Tax=Caballeronia udeis TaxID=1232866 RepID=A0A158JZF2_9BURK|nr:hypothetical protein AWB69_09149 [Caballeronia udeis]
MGERAQGAYNEIGVNKPNDTSIDSIFQLVSK